MKTRSDKTAKPWIKHIWEIHAHLKCPLIGACLSVNEHKIKAGQKALELKVRRSDLVLCPVNCNSHGACNKVKAFCKKYGKPVRMLPGSSLSMISGALMENGRRTDCTG